MEYIVYNELTAKVICGDVHLDRGEVATEKAGLIKYRGKPICFNTSEIAHQHFSRNDDGNGLERGDLILSIFEALKPGAEDYEEKWAKVYDDEVCQKYRREEFAENWLWNHAFYNAPIEDLDYILNLVTE